MKKQKTYWIVNDNMKPLEVILVGKYIPDHELFHSKFNYIYQVQDATRDYAKEIEVERERIYLKKKDAELALDAAYKLLEIEKAEKIIKEYKHAVEVIKQAKKDGLKDIDFVFKLTDEKKKK